MRKTIEITIQPNGQTTVETKGFTGAECREASRFIEKALGATTCEQLTTEFYQPASSQESNTQRN